MYERRTIRWGKEAYCPISIESIRLNTRPDFPLYFRPGAGRNFILYCDRGLVFSTDARQRLTENKIAHLYVLEQDRGHYSRYLADHLEEILRDNRLEFHEKTAILFDSSQAVIEQLFADPASPNNLRRGKDVVRHTVDLMTQDDFRLEDLLKSISGDYQMYTHCLNVVAYSVALAMHLGYSDHATLREIANGALLHDIGKTKLPKELLDKNGHWTDAEQTRLRAHPVLGHQMLSEMGTVGEIALDIVLHHHEHLDGTGYPDHLDVNRISPFVRIVSIANVFDVLTTGRYQQPAKTSFQALHTMQRRMLAELDLIMIRSLIEVLGIVRPS